MEYVNMYYATTDNSWGKVQDEPIEILKNSRHEVQLFKGSEKKFNKKFKELVINFFLVQGV